MEVDLDHLRKWIGMTEERLDQVTQSPLVRMSATLDRDDTYPQPGDAVPLLWHWLYFLPAEKRSNLKEDGHGKLGGFMPPVPLPRRMWAGSRLDHIKPLRVGENIRRISKIKDVTYKQGRSGKLVFVLVHHEIYGEDGLAIHEEHDIVYREMPAPGTPAVTDPATRPPPEEPKWTWTVTPDIALLFRYSALIFYAHRIHYDHEFTTGVEGYPGLIVHGPLLATLMLELCRREMPEAQFSKFEFRAQSPIFMDHPFVVAGGPSADGKSANIWVSDPNGGTAMRGETIIATNF
jgi:3-methylfumaryl-CoA hydratase